MQHDDQHDDQLEDLVGRLVGEYDPPTQKGPKPMSEVMVDELNHYDTITDEDRFPVVFIFEAFGENYLARVVAPLVTKEHPIDVIPVVAKMFKESGMPQPDAVMMLIDSWSYPQELLDAVEAQGDPDESMKRFRALWQAMPPSQHPQRVNISICHVIYKNGHQEAASQTRGQPETFRRINPNDEGVKISGRVIEAMKAWIA